MCRAGCPTGGHDSWGACLRDAHVGIAYANSAGGWDYSKEKRFQREQEGYRQAVKDGLNPAGVDSVSVRRAYDDASKG